MTTKTKLTDTQLTILAHASRRGGKGLLVPKTLKARGGGIEARLILGDRQDASAPDQALVRLIGRAHVFMNELTTGSCADLAQLSQKAGLLPLAFLVPDLTRAMMEGRQPVELAVQRLKRIKPIPPLWQQQQQRLGFPVP